jgi:hypothetical protein
MDITGAMASTGNSSLTDWRLPSMILPRYCDIIPSHACFRRPIDTLPRTINCDRGATVPKVSFTAQLQAIAAGAKYNAAPLITPNPIVAYRFIR